VAAPATDRQITLGRIALVLTLLAWATYILVTVLSQFVNRGFQGCGSLPRP
jgi:cellulose synthase (UDP-forming)